ncbi:MAG: sulfotransferase [Candidatus Thalassarchaeaceae archaeon]|nr:sulfotransferase [Candidatus Thalassarchaeaceae archaeon]MDP7091268.1 sulfotransferase [Candidatus Thalassarchaeaceae archaeon]MDP7256637.1 sulfotransferase [Candidatus Thalassarchaeaceae archaeon]MDP7445758.1 sulfotransferase [Candidatus Thalassarchaeaceae archaeon]
MVIGMHRSGTSLVSRLLDQSGVLMGKDLQSDHESKFFIGLNKWIYSNAGADWARPSAVAELVDFEPARENVEQYLRVRVSSRSSRKFSGRTLRNGLLDLDCPWGWKDPRNGPALSFWQSIWPEMKIIRVVRHGVDVAASLKNRSSRHWAHASSRFEKWLPQYRWRSSKSPIRRGQRAATLSNAFEFWAEQMSVERAALEGRDGILEIRYEELLTEPEASLGNILEYISAPEDPNLLSILTESMDPSRAFAYKEDQDLRAFAERNSETLGKFGYGP